MQNENMVNYKVLIALMGMEIGGAETHVLELCKALHKKGLDVYVVSNGGAYEQELLDSGIKHFKIPLHNKKISSLISSYHSLKKLIIEHDIKLVHAHARIPAFLCGLLQKKLKFRFVTTAHLDFNTAWPYKLLTNWGEASLAVADDIKEYLIDNYKVSPEKIIVTINGIDTENFSADIDYSDILEEFKLDESKKRIVYISRMDTDRSFAGHKLIEIAESVYEKDKHIEILIVGGGGDFEAVKKEAEAVNSRLGTQLITLTGGRTDINKFIAAADIFVGVSRSVLEAMAGARPVIVAGNQGYIGIFDESQLEAGIDTNFCCRGYEQTSADALKRDLFTLMDYGNEKLTELGAYSRSIIKQYYSVDKMADDALALYEMVRKPKKEIDVMISGYYGSDNHGDDALLKAITDDLRSFKPDLNIVVISKRPRETERIYGVKSIRKFNFLAISLHLRKTNLLITGGGSLIADITSTQSLVYYLYVINSALKARAKVMLYANGIGPLRLEQNKKRAAKVLNKVDLITLRDEVSLDVLKSLNIQNPNVIVTSDAVLSLKNTDPQRAAERINQLGLTDKKYFCVALRSWKTLKDNFISEITNFCDYVRDTYGCEAIFVPMQPSYDAEISISVINAMKNKAYYLGEEFSVNEILGIVSGAEFVLGMRLHTIIYAAGCGTPVMGLVYDPKVEAMMKRYNQPFYISVEATASAALKQFADEIIANRAEISDNIKQTSAILEKKAFDNAQMAYNMINRNLF